MNSIQYKSGSEEATLNLAKHLAKYLKGGNIVCLYGDLGSGKTTFTKGLAEGSKINMKGVHSPTFTLLNIYEGLRPIYHFDLYRMDDIGEILNIGYEEFFYGEGVAVVEWADKLKSLLPEEYLKVEFKHQGENTRSIELTGVGADYVELLERFKKEKIFS